MCSTIPAWTQRLEEQLAGDTVRPAVAQQDSRVRQRRDMVRAVINSRGSRTFEEHEAASSAM
jgi:hypothetical protein